MEVRNDKWHFVCGASTCDFCFCDALNLIATYETFRILSTLIILSFAIIELKHRNYSKPNAIALGMRMCITN